MRCSACQHENREGAKFCRACGAKLEFACSVCGVLAEPGAAFCDNCGAALETRAKGKGRKPKGQDGLASRVQSRRTKEQRRSETGSTLDSRPSDSRPHIGERRQLTVLFCDVVGSTALSARMDPEEWQTIVQNYQHVCGEVIRRFDGHVAQYLGDGILVYFGYPAAHEDDAQRAVRTALEIVTSLKKQFPSPLVKEEQGEEIFLRVRIGIHTGLVVISEIGDGVKRELLALGETPNLAARLQSAAEPDSVVVSESTYRLVEGLFDCQALPALDLKGVATPMQAFHILGESEARSRLEVAALRGLTPLVGREEEVGLLLKRWEQAAAGAGQVVLLNGEAGIGKSRLVQVLKDHISHNKHPRVEWRCSPYHQNSALYPVIEQLQRLLQFARENSPEEKFRKLETQVKELSSLPYEAIPLLASLLTLPLPDRYPPLTSTPQRQKQKTLETLLAWLLYEAQQQPVLMVVEDLHWIDPSTLELLSLLLDQVPSARLLVVLTFRPDFTPPWPLAAHLTQLTLNRFARGEIETMVRRVAKEDALPQDLVQQIVARTDGVPLFVEELTKMVLEDRGAHHTMLLQTIPTTLQDSLMARLDRLNTAKEVAQLGATIGREFSYELLRAVAFVDEKNLRSALAKLVDSELLYQRGQPPTAHYTFKHALIQDTAYQSLLKSTRQHYHQRIAQILEEQFPESKETQPELLAQHYTEAGLVERAISYWREAGQRATERSANTEAISHLTTGLELLKTLPDTPKRTQQELALQLAQSGPLMSTKGPATPEVEQAYARALSLCRQLEDTPQLFPVLVGLRIFYTVRGELQTACELGEQLLRLAQRVHDPALLGEAHIALGVPLNLLGELASAREHLERGLALCDPQQRASIYRYGADIGVIARTLLAQLLWVLGYPNQARECSLEALTRAQEVNLPFSTAVAWNLTTVLLQFLHEPQAIQQRAEALRVLCHEQGLSGYFAGAIVPHGWALALQGQEEVGIQQIQQGLATVRATGTEVYRPYYLALLAEAHGKTGQIEEGLIILIEAMAAVDRTGERWYEAELYRLKGELLQQLKM